MMEIKLVDILFSVLVSMICNDLNKTHENLIKDKALFVHHEIFYCINHTLNIVYAKIMINEHESCSPKLFTFEEVCQSEVSIFLNVL